MDLNKSLIEFGLKDKQAKVYLACMELGSASILQISQLARLPRSTTEIVLKQLLDKGFVSSFKKKKSKYFSPQDPHKIVDSAKQTAISLESVLPDLMAMYGTSKNRPSVRFYEGKNGIKMVLREVLAEAKQIVSFGSSGNTYTVLGDIWLDFIENRVKRKIPVRVLDRPTPETLERAKTAASKLRQVKFVKDLPGYAALQMNWNNKIMMLSLKQDLFAIVIESKELAEVHKALFDYIWNKN